MKKQIDIFKKQLKNSLKIVNFDKDYQTKNYYFKVFK